METVGETDPRCSREREIFADPANCGEHVEGRCMQCRGPIIDFGEIHSEISIVDDQEEAVEEQKKSLTNDSTKWCENQPSQGQFN